MAFRVTDYKKNVMTIIRGGNIQSSLPHRLHTRLYCVFGGIGRLQTRIDLLRKLGSKDTPGKLGDLIRHCVFPEHKNYRKYEHIGMYMHENMTICIFFSFYFRSKVLFVFLCVKIGHIPFSM